MCRFFSFFLYFEAIIASISETIVFIRCPSMLLQAQTFIELLDDGILLLFDVLADKYDFYHSVTILVIPFLLQLRVVSAKLSQLVSWHRCEPLSCLLYSFLLSCLFEYIAHVWFVSKIADTLGTYYVTRPFSGYEFIKES